MSSNGRPDVDQRPATSDVSGRSPLSRLRSRGAAGATAVVLAAGAAGCGGGRNVVHTGQYMPEATVTRMAHFAGIPDLGSGVLHYQHQQSAGADTILLNDKEYDFFWNAVLFAGRSSNAPGRVSYILCVDTQVGDANENGHEIVPTPQLIGHGSFLSTQRTENKNAVYTAYDGGSRVWACSSSVAFEAGTETVESRLVFFDTEGAIDTEVATIDLGTWETMAIKRQRGFLPLDEEHLLDILDPEQQVHYGAASIAPVLARDSLVFRAAGPEL